MGDAPAPLDPATHRRLAVELFNETWQRLGQPDRSAADDAALIHTAHASCRHWLEVGTAANRARGEWQVARVHSELGDADAALRHARLALELVEAGGDGFEDWDLASALEGLARATLVAGDRESAVALARRSRQALAGVADPEDREIVARDLDALGLEAATDE